MASLLGDVVAHLDRKGVPFALIGATALASHGLARHLRHRFHCGVPGESRNLGKWRVKGKTKAVSPASPVARR